MLSLFNTRSEMSGFRLQYMEIYNWGTFHEKIFRMAPEGNNALLTGANASGKSTLIDALLTLMVPAKKDRFYNQSSGVEKKGNRTEETYVLGHYGNIQKDGENAVTTQALRDQSTYSVLLASFMNTDDQHVVTVFQVRWFSSGELRRTFGLAHCPLEIQRDFQPFDGRGNWRKRLEAAYKGPRTMVEFFDGPVGYAERMTQLLGMRSVKALSLFNQIVGVKVLDDLDDFIRTNMLEELDAEGQYIQLKDSFTTLIEAKNNIEKASMQIEMLRPIAALADKIGQADDRLKQLSMDKDTAVYWFARQLINMGEERLSWAEKSKTQLQKELEKLRAKEEKLRQEERSLAIAIEQDEVGRKVKELEDEARQLAELRDQHMKKMDEYNRLAEQLSLKTNPQKDTFLKQQDEAAVRCERIRDEQEDCIRQTIALENEQNELAKELKEQVEYVELIRKNKNNIPAKEMEIRDALLRHTGATKEELPFVGELIRVRDDEKEWEVAIEKILHHFALHLIVPEKYYHQVAEYLNENNVGGRILFFRYVPYCGLNNASLYDWPEDTLISKIEIKDTTEYEEWVRDTILEKFNYTCVPSLEDFERCKEKAVTREGLIKTSGDRHEKDDRPHVLKRENYVLGWENQEKLRLLQQEIRQMQEQENEKRGQQVELEKKRRALELQQDALRKLTELFTDYELMDWTDYAQQYQNKMDGLEALRRESDHVKTLHEQLEKVREELKQVSQMAIEAKTKEIFGQEHLIEQTQTELSENQKVIASIKSLLFTDFEKEYAYLCELTYDQLKQERGEFQKKNERARGRLAAEKRGYEDEAKILIAAFKHPDEEITERFKDWRSDVDALPDANHIELIEAYTTMLVRLEKENLPKYEKQFDGYIQKTLIDKVGEFRMFFVSWVDSIKENIAMLNESLKGIEYRKAPSTYIQLVTNVRINEEVRTFRKMMEEAIPDVKRINASPEGRRDHFYDHIEPLMRRLEDEDWRDKVMDARGWFTYKAEEFNQSTGRKETTYENMGHLSGGEKAQLTYTILGSAIAYQFGLTKSGAQANSFRFIAIDEAFKAQDETKARYLINLCKQLHLQLLVVTPNDNIHIVENDISYVYFTERKEEKTSWLYSMPIEQWEQKKNNTLL